MALALTDEQLGLVRTILDSAVPGTERVAFGSRLGTVHHHYSDLDIGILADTPIPLSTLSALEEAFAESDLPFRVDVVDLHRVSETFRRLVFANHVRI
ncbi:MAG: nucleotidyltransferase domain-containing protein [Gemmataceae bacterium]